MIVYYQYIKMETSSLFARAGSNKIESIQQVLFQASCKRIPTKLMILAHLMTPLKQQIRDLEELIEPEIKSVKQLLEKFKRIYSNPAFSKRILNLKQRIARSSNRLLNVSTEFKSRIIIDQRRMKALQNQHCQQIVQSVEILTQKIQNKLLECRGKIQEVHHKKYQQQSQNQNDLTFFSQQGSNADKLDEINKGLQMILTHTKSSVKWLDQAFQQSQQRGPQI